MSGSFGVSGLRSGLEILILSGLSDELIDWKINESGDLDFLINYFINSNEMKTFKDPKISSAVNSLIKPGFSWPGLT